MTTFVLFETLVLSPVVESIILLGLWRIFIAIFLENERPSRLRPFLIYAALSVGAWGLIHGLVFEHLGTGVASGLAFGGFCALMFWLERRHGTVFVFLYLTLAHVAANIIALIARAT